MNGILVAVVLTQSVSLSSGRDVAQRVQAGDASVYGDVSRALQRGWRSPRAVNALATAVRRNFGTERRLMSERLDITPTGGVYRRLSQFNRYARGVETVVVLDADGRAERVSISPAQREAPEFHVGIRARTKLRAPFGDAWLVLWGGERWEVNRHTSVSDQRFATDFVQWKDGRTYTGRGQRNEDYFCFDTPLVAPSDGVVVAAVDGIRDNAPGQVNPTDLYGNFVVIDHGGGEFSLLGHLKNGSVAVRAGDEVRAGELLARTGNSGTSTEPHLHFQMMNDAHWLQAHGLRYAFEHVVVDGRAARRIEPLRGQFISARDRPGEQRSQR